MQMQVIAPCPKKPSSSSSSSTGGSSSNYYYYDNNNYWSNNNMNLDIQDACLELQQILSSTWSSLGVQQQEYYDNITRTGNPLVQDSSFIPSCDANTLHQAVSQLSVSPSTSTVVAPTTTGRPRSYSVGDPRNHYILQPSVY